MSGRPRCVSPAGRRTAAHPRGLPLRPPSKVRPHGPSPTCARGRGHRRRHRRRAAAARDRWHAARSPAAGASSAAPTCGSAGGTRPRVRRGRGRRPCCPLPRRRRRHRRGPGARHRPSPPGRRRGVARRQGRGGRRARPSAPPTSCCWRRPPPARPRSLATPSTAGRHVVSVADSVAAVEDLLDLHAEARERGVVVAVGAGLRARSVLRAGPPRRRRARRTSTRCTSPITAPAARPAPDSTTRRCANAGPRLARPRLAPSAARARAASSASSPTRSAAPTATGRACPTPCCWSRRSRRRAGSPPGWPPRAATGSRPVCRCCVRRTPRGASAACGSRCGAGGARPATRWCSEPSTARRWRPGTVAGVTARWVADGQSADHRCRGSRDAGRAAAVPARAGPRRRAGGRVRGHLSARRRRTSGHTPACHPVRSAARVTRRAPPPSAPRPRHRPRRRRARGACGDDSGGDASGPSSERVGAHDERWRADRSGRRGHRRGRGVPCRHERPHRGGPRPTTRRPRPVASTTRCRPRAGSTRPSRRPTSCWCTTSSTAPSGSPTTPGSTTPQKSSAQLAGRPAGQGHRHAVPRPRVAARRHRVGPPVAARQRRRSAPPAVHRARTATARTPPSRTAACQGIGTPTVASPTA